MSKSFPVWEKPEIIYRPSRQVCLILGINSAEYTVDAKCMVKLQKLYKKQLKKAVKKQT